MSDQPARINFHSGSFHSSDPELLAELREDPRIAKGLFFALPTTLIDAIERNLDDKIPAADLKFERKATSVLAGLVTEPPSDNPPVKTWSASGVSDQDIAKTRAALVSSQADRNRIRIAQAAYIGWLTTNSEFISEHDELMKNHQSRLSTNGFPVLGNFNVAAAAKKRPAKKGPKIGKITDDKVLTYLSDFEAFFVRWRLQGLNAPYIPEPLGPQFPVLDPQRMSNQMAAGGLTLFLPDTFPTPGCDELRNLVEQALGRYSATPPEHLQAWTEIIAGDTMAKNQLPHYARIARLQLYWTALHSRYAAQLKRSKEKLTAAFSEFFGCDDKTIKRDLKLISERFSRNWPRPYHGAI